jgi:cytochrome c6
LIACALVLLALPGAAGCGESGEEEAAARRRAAAAALVKREVALGRRVFATHCQSCHTMAGKRYTGPIIEFEAPNLDEVRLKRHYVEYRLQYGGPAMASFTTEIPPDGLRALATYVAETAGGDVTDGDPPADQLAAGKEVFAQSCAICHGIAGRTMQGRPIYPGMDFNLIKPSPAMVREKALDGVMEGEMMPAFRGRLSAQEIEDVAAYVNAVAAEGPEAPRTPFEDLNGE